MDLQQSQAPALTAVVHGIGSKDEALTLLRRVVRGLPAGSAVLFATERPVVLERALARTVTAVVVTGPADLEAHALSAAAAGSTAVLVDGRWTLGSGWCDELLERLAASGGAVCSVVEGQHRLTAYPAGAHATTRRLPCTLERVSSRQGALQPLRDSRRTLSAVLIVKDEEERLGACLASLEGLVDEVVVYDTGSTDRTVRIARNAGARVVEGYWDDDFAGARNRALQHASGEWVLSIDADEVFEGDPTAFRKAVDATRSPAMPVAIVSVEWEGAAEGASSVVPRLFRRAGHRWFQALHEQLVQGDGRPTSWAPVPPPGRLRHFGYTKVSIAERGKAERNVTVSHADMLRTAPETPERWSAASAYGRSLLLAGRVEEGLAVMQEVLHEDASPTLVILTARSALRPTLERQDFETARRWIDRAELSGESAGRTALFRAELFGCQGQLDEAIAVLGPFLRGEVPLGRDFWGGPFPEHELLDGAARIELARGNTAEAAALVERVLRSAPDQVNFKRLVTTLRSRGDDLVEIIAACPDSFLDRSLRELASSSAEEVMEWCEAFAAVHPGDPRPVVAACVASRRAGWEAALHWTLAARNLGITSVSGLRTLSGAVGAPALDRCIATALDLELDPSQAALRPLLHLLERLPGEDVDRVLSLLSQHTPRTFQRMVEASDLQPA